MNVSASPIIVGAYTYWAAILLDNDGHTVRYRCEHGHYYPQSAYDCARYERDKRMRSTTPS